MIKKIIYIFIEHLPKKVGAFLGGEKLENISVKEIIRSKEEKRILTR